jgi:excisionase family DNA binding protein
MAERQLAPITAAADRAACSTKTIRRMIARGDLTGYRLGKRMIRVDLDELDALLRPIVTTDGAA